MRLPERLPVEPTSPQPLERVHPQLPSVVDERTVEVVPVSELQLLEPHHEVELEHCREVELEPVLWL